ncbi:energy transducer TonB [Helicobacter suis]|uniref:energy transducer TonB n=1 Tax=Helicobacter suis TaxID=104628 RepID=UPI000CF01F15|nr:energy transducer TonB [Helicobacter suis]
MKTSPSLQKKSKSATWISFFITLILYAGALWAFFSNSNHIQKIAQAGTQSVTMSLASINTHANHLSHAKQAPQVQEKPKDKPKEQPKPKPKPKPKPQEKPKPEPKVQEKPKPEPKPKVEEKPQPKQETKPKEAPPQKAPPAKEPPKEKPKKVEQSNQTAEGAKASLAYNQGVSDAFLMQIQQAISSKNRYPRMAMARGIEGEVLVEFVLNANGSTEDIKISKSSGSDILNHAALQAVKEASKLFPAPKHTVRLRIPIAYTIKEE